MLEIIGEVLRAAESDAIDNHRFDGNGDHQIAVLSDVAEALWKQLPVAGKVNFLNSDGIAEIVKNGFGYEVTPTSLVGKLLKQIETMEVDLVEADFEIAENKSTGNFFYVDADGNASEDFYDRRDCIVEAYDGMKLAPKEASVDSPSR